MYNKIYDCYLTLTFLSKIIRSMTVTTFSACANDQKHFLATYIHIVIFFFCPFGLIMIVISLTSHMFTIMVKFILFSFDRTDIQRLNCQSTENSLIFRILLSTLFPTFISETKQTNYKITIKVKVALPPDCAFTSNFFNRSSLSTLHIFA